MPAVTPPPDAAHLHLSQLLRELAPPGGHNGLTVGAIVDHLKDRGPAAVLALLALPIALPIPMPGISAVFGPPMLLISLQLVAPQKRFWLPESIRRRPVELAKLAPAIARATPWLERLEVLLRPRLRFMCRPAMQMLYGVICAWLSLILFLPVPFGNVLPCLAMFALGLALLERDGIAAIIGLLLSVVSIVVTAATTTAMIFGVVHLAQGFFGI